MKLQNVVHFYPSVVLFGKKNTSCTSIYSQLSHNCMHGTIQIILAPFIVNKWDEFDYARSAGVREL